MWVYRLELKNWLFYNPSIIQKLDGVFVPAMLPHQGEDPDPAFAENEMRI
jgi:hypothetical protein